MPRIMAIWPLAALLITIAFAPTAHADFRSNCTSSSIDADASRLQGDGFPLHDPIIAALGGQYGGLWYCLPTHVLSVGVAPGPEDLASADATVDAIIDQQLGPAEGAWVKAHTDVIAVPYSDAQLDQAVAEIGAQMPGEPTPSAWTGVGKGVGTYPIVILTLNIHRTDADVAAAQQLVDRYGGLVRLELSDDDGISTMPLVGIVHPAVRSAAATLTVSHHGRGLRVAIDAHSPLHDVSLSAYSARGRLLARSSARRVRSHWVVALRVPPHHGRLDLRLRGRNASGKEITARRTA